MKINRYHFLFVGMVLFLNQATHAGALDIFFKRVGKNIAKTAKKVGESVADSVVGFGKNLAEGKLDEAFADLGRAIGTVTTSGIRLSYAVSPVGWVGAVTKNPVDKVVDGVLDGVENIGEMAGRQVGGTLDIVGKTAVAAAKNPKSSLNIAKTLEGIGRGTYEYGRAQFYENMKATVKDMVDVGRAFAKGRILPGLMGVIDTVENHAVRAVEATSKGVGTAIGTAVGSKRIAREIEEQTTANLQLALGVAQFVVPVPLFGAGEYDPFGVVLGNVIGQFTDAPLDGIPTDRAGCPVDPESQKIRANIGDGAHIYTIEQLVCHLVPFVETLQTKIVKRFSADYWKDMANRGIYLVFKKRNPGGFFLLLEDVEGYFNLQPDPVESGGAAASEVYYDPADGATLIALTDGREVEGQLGSIKSMYCFSNEKGVLVGDPHCTASVKTYAVPLAKGIVAPTPQEALAGALRVAEKPVVQQTVKAPMGMMHSPAPDSGLAAALGGTVGLPQRMPEGPIRQESSPPIGTPLLAGALGAALEGGAS